MSLSGRYLAATGLVILVVATVSPSVAVEFTDYYKVGLAAVDTEDWVQVSEMMQLAIEIEPKSRTKIKRALGSKPYIPHFYLGLALYSQGRCDESLAVWREAEAQGVVTKFPQHQQRIEEGLEGCELRYSQREARLAEVQASLETALTARDEARMLLGDLMLAGAEEAEYLSERLDSAESKLEEASVAITSPEINSDLLRQAASKIATAVDGFESVNFECSRWLESIVAEKVRVRSDLEQLVLDGKRGLRASEHLDPFPPRIAGLRQRINDLVQQAENLEALGNEKKAAQLASELEKTIAELEELSDAPPPELVVAAEAFLEGRYELVLQALSSIEQPSARVASQAHLFRAAALYSLHRAKGEADEEMLEQAGEEVRSYLNLGGAIEQLPPQIFSPRFIEFFESQRKLTVIASN